MSQSKSIESFRDLIAWQKSMNLVGETYQFTRQLPNDERYGLTSQMRRSAVSIPSNIAEGWGRETKQDYLRFLQMSRGSAHELSTQAELCHRLEYEGQWMVIINHTEEVCRILNALMKALRRSSHTRKHKD